MAPPARIYVAAVIDTTHVLIPLLMLSTAPATGIEICQISATELELQSRLWAQGGHLMIIAERLLCGTKLPFAASAPKDGLSMSALRTKRTFSSRGMIATFEHEELLDHYASAAGSSRYIRVAQ